MNENQLTKNLAAVLGERDEIGTEIASLTNELPLLRKDRDRTVKNAKPGDEEAQRHVAALNTRIDYAERRIEHLKQTLGAKDGVIYAQLNRVVERVRTKITELQKAAVDRAGKGISGMFDGDEAAGRAFIQNLVSNPDKHGLVLPLPQKCNRALTRLGVALPGPGRTVAEAARQLLSQITYIEKDLGPLS